MTSVRVHPRFPRVHLREPCLVAVVEERPDVERVRAPTIVFASAAMFNAFLQAIARLTPREQYDRAFRFKRASQCSVLHDVLPKDQWTSPSQVRATFVLISASLIWFALRTYATSSHTSWRSRRRTRSASSGTTWRSSAGDRCSVDWHCTAGEHFTFGHNETSSSATSIPLILPYNPSTNHARRISCGTPVTSR